MIKRKILAFSLSLACPLSITQAQQQPYTAVAATKPSVPTILRPYFAVDVPPIRLANSARLGQLVRGGTLYLTVQDAIALALENNIDIEVARYNPLIANWNVTRAEAGGALPGVPSNSAQVGAAALGQGVAGSLAAAGISLPGSSAKASQTSSTTIQQIGPVTQTLDPIIQEASTFSHTTNLEPVETVSGTATLIDVTRAHSLSYTQGLLTGGSATVSYADNYLNENSPADVLNPSSGPSLSFSFQQGFLQGFGIAVNARFITVAKMNAGISDFTFQSQVINVVAQVLNAYYNLEAADEDSKAKRNAAEVARTFLANVKEQVRLGSLAPSDIINAESQLVTSDQALVDSDADRQQQEVRLRNLLSRPGTADPVLTSTHIEPVDHMTIPDHDDLPPLEDLVKQALSNRTDLITDRENERAGEVSNLGTRNGVLPTLGVFAGGSSAGLSGAAHTASIDGITIAPNPALVGGIGNALQQVFSFSYPTESITGYYAAPLRNRQALADYAVDQLSFRQTQLSTQKDAKQAEVDVLNDVIALRQARARHEAAVRSRILQEQLLTSEQKRFALGASIPYNVIQQQRDLANAQSAEVAALTAYTNARLALDRTTGALLAAYHVSLAEARIGQVVRAAKLPETPAQP
ncbi:MAG: TolC family protein [Bryobacteraceae bacterium]